MTSGLTKQFSQRVAVDGLDLKIPTGSISGFVGPNGAGKTTTIRMLLGLVRPTSGTACVLGHSISEPSSYLPRVGALIEGPTFYPTLSGRENLFVLARLGGLGYRRVDEVLEQVGLAPRARDRYSTYSLGMRQRLGIAAAILPRPELVVLDEPTNGLDPHGIAEIRSMLRSLADEGMTVFVSSHLLSEIQQVCEHLVVIEHGGLVFQGSVAALLAGRAPELVVATECSEDAGRLLALLERLGRCGRVASAQIGSGAAGSTLGLSCAPDCRVEVVGDASFAGELNRLAMAEGITLVHLTERRATLEEVFFEITGRGPAGTKLGAAHSPPPRCSSAVGPELVAAAPGTSEQERPASTNGQATEQAAPSTSRRAPP